MQQKRLAPPNNCLPYLKVTDEMAATSVNEQKGHSTIKAPATIDAEADAGVLRKAMKGIGESSSYNIMLITKLSHNLFIYVLQVSRYDGIL